MSAVLARGSTTHEVAGSVLTLPIERRFGDIDSIQRYADRVLSLPSVTLRWPGLAPVRVRARAGSRRAHYERARVSRASGDLAAVIAVPTDRDGRWAMREMVVLHEIAHHIAAAIGRESGRSPESTSPVSGEPAHGPTFTAVYCTLTGIAIGPEVELMLRVAFDGVGVPVGVA